VGYGWMTEDSWFGSR